MSWEMTIIGDHCTVTSSKRFHLSERSNSGVPFYCSKEIIQKNRGEEITDCDYISEELYLNIAEKFGVPQENDLLVTTRGTIGVPYLYRRNDRFYFADGNLTWIKDFKESSRKTKWEKLSLSSHLLWIKAQTWLLPSCLW